MTAAQPPAEQIKPPSVISEQRPLSDHLATCRCKFLRASEALHPTHHVKLFNELDRFGWRRFHR